MKFPKTRLWFIIIGITVLGLVIAIAGWSSTRFNRISVCTTCHEIFVDYDEYKQTAPLSESVEDFRPTKEYDPGYFNVTVGCAECHAYPYEEYKESPHYDNERGVKAGCVGCHEPHSVREILAWKFFYINSGSTGDSPFHAVSNSLRDIPEWEKLRIKLATKARKKMMEEDSAKCKVCHKTEGLWFAKKKQHQTTKKTCVKCHYNLVHKSVRWHD
ncbi:MAG TPA: hypothetical protein ENK59_00170 [Thioploca sp.]|nr:hypothetical protein [Thioploca sp.]